MDETPTVGLHKGRERSSDRHGEQQATQDFDVTDDSSKSVSPDCTIETQQEVFTQFNLFKIVCILEADVLSKRAVGFLL